MTSPYVELGKIARNKLGMQCQYAAQYVKDSGVSNEAHKSYGERFKKEDFNGDSDSSRRYYFRSKAC